MLNEVKQEVGKRGEKFDEAAHVTLLQRNFGRRNAVSRGSKVFNPAVAGKGTTSNKGKRKSCRNRLCGDEIVMKGEAEC